MRSEFTSTDISPEQPEHGRHRRSVRDLPAALLIFMMLVSLAYMLPVYCLWLCPFKLTATSLVPSDDEATEYHCPETGRAVQFPPESVEVKICPLLTPATSLVPSADEATQ